MRNLLKNFVIILLIFLVISGIFALFFQPFEEKKEVSLTQLVEEINQGKITKITVLGNNLEIVYQDETKAVSMKEIDTALSQSLINYGVNKEKLKEIEITTKEQEDIWSWLMPLLFILPLLVFGVFFWMIFRQARGGAMQAFDFTKAKARLFGAEGHSKEKITFKDVAGLKEAKEELMEVVDFLKNPKKFLQMGARIPRGVLLMGSPGTGKCITGDTIVWTNKGLIEINKIPHYYYVDEENNAYGTKVDSLNINSPIKTCLAKASHWYCLGKQKTIKIKLAQGFELEGTPEHPVIILNDKGALEFKKIEELQINDKVAIQFGQQRFGANQTITPETAYFMGILTGDGNLSTGSRVGLTGKDQEIIKFFKKYIRKYFPNSAIYRNKDDYLVSSWQLKRYLYLLGMSYLLSFDKTIPPTVLQAPKEVIVSFLQGLFDTDASIAKKRAVFEYSTVSKKLAKQVQMCLLNLGVIPQLNIKGNPIYGYKRPVWRLTVTGTALPIFAQEIGFRLSRKRKLLEEHITKQGQGTNTNIDLLYSIASLVEKEWKSLSSKKLSNKYWSKSIYKIRDRKRISRLSLKRFLEYTKKINYNSPTILYLAEILNSNLFFSPLVEKTEGFALVYDFTIEKTHAFIGNGFVNHNTLLARAVAGEAHVPFFHMSGSEFVEMFVGVGAGRVRDLFFTAKKAAPAIIFIDELDAIGRHRGTGLGGGHDEREQTLNQILVEMDGFERDTKLIVVSATNRPDVLDPALLRPGRFDRRVVLDLPDINDREEILKIHCLGKPLALNINLREVAERTPGFSGADLANVVNEAAILAARKNKQQVFQEELLESIEKVLLGPERKSHVLSKKEKRIAAYHEAGHALVSAFLPGTEPIRKISIVARGMAAGYTIKMPHEEKRLRTKSEFLAEIATLLAGFCAEKLKFGEITTGASNDLEKASHLVRKLVKEYGMSSLGPISFGEKEELIFLGKELGEQRNYSEKVAARIDKEVENFIKTAENTAKKILNKEKRLLEKIAQTLIEKETIEREEFENLIKPEKTKKIEAPKLSTKREKSLEVKIKQV